MTNVKMPPHRVLGSLAKKVGIVLSIFGGFWLWSFYLAPLFFKTWSNHIAGQNYATYAHPWLTLGFGFFWLFIVAAVLFIGTLLLFGLYEVYKAEEKKLIIADKKKVLNTIKSSDASPDQHSPDYCAPGCVHIRRTYP